MFRLKRAPVGLSARAPVGLSARAPVGLSARAPVGWMPESIFDVRSKIQELLGTKAQRSANQDAWQSQEDIEAAQSTENHQETTPEAWYYPRDAQPGHIKS